MKNKDKQIAWEAQRLDDAARDFHERIIRVLGQHHPLARLFSGLMMMYQTDEADLVWAEIAMRPWFADSEAKSETQEREIILNVLWLCAAARANKK